MATRAEIYKDIHDIIEGCTGASSVMDELTLLRASLRAYTEGMTAADAVAWACQALSDSITKRPSK